MDLSWTRSNDEDGHHMNESITSSSTSAAEWPVESNAGGDRTTAETTPSAAVPKSEYITTTNNTKTPQRQSSWPNKNRSKKKQKARKKASTFKTKTNPRNYNDFKRTLTNRFLTELVDTEIECFGEMDEAMSDEFSLF